MNGWVEIGVDGWGEGVNGRGVVKGMGGCMGV